MLFGQDFGRKNRPVSTEGRPATCFTASPRNKHIFAPSTFRDWRGSPKSSPTHKLNLWTLFAKAGPKSRVMSNQSLPAGNQPPYGARKRNAGFYPINEEMIEIICEQSVKQTRLLCTEFQELIHLHHPLVSHCHCHWCSCRRSPGLSAGDLPPKWQVGMLLVVAQRQDFLSDFGKVRKAISIVSAVGSGPS